MSLRKRARGWLRRIAGWAVRNELVSISDPRLIQWLRGDAGDMTVTEHKALGLSAFYRGVLLVSASIAGLPLRTLRDVRGTDRDGKPVTTRTRVSSLFDDAGPGEVVGLKPFNWKQIQVIHLILWGDAFLRHIFNGAGALVGLEPIHPAAVKVEWDRNAKGGKRYTFKDSDGKRVELDASGMTQIMGPSIDGLRGLSVLTLARKSLGGAIAADKAAAKMWRDGLLVPGVFVPEEDLTDTETEELADELVEKLAGIENANEIRTLNKRVKFVQLSMPAKDAQFLQSRQFSIQEVARWLGVPANLLMDPGAVSTWGTGVEIQNRGLARFTLTSFTIPMQEAYTSIIKGERFIEFDFAGLERGSPQEEIELLLRQVEAGVMSIEEFCRIRNMAPPDPSETYVAGPLARRQTAAAPESSPPATDLLTPAVAGITAAALAAGIGATE